MRWAACGKQRFFQRRLSAEANRATQASVPIQISKNQVWLDVMLNGKGPFHFAFDTGGANVIDSAVANELGVASGGSAEVTGVGSEPK
jgi:hypothetical protein